MNLLTSNLRRIITLMIVACTLTVAFATFTPTQSEAATVRTGARWDHVDLLMTRDETSSVARGVAGGGSLCWGTAGTFAAIGGTAGTVIGGPWGAVAGAAISSIVGGGYCMLAVTTCAARANIKGRSAGMTFAPTWRGGIQFWCWDY
jgi:hypothetical protein